MTKMKQECIPVGCVLFADGNNSDPLSKVRSTIKFVSPGRTVVQDVLHSLDQQSFLEHI